MSTMDMFRSKVVAGMMILGCLMVPISGWAETFTSAEDKFSMTFPEHFAPIERLDSEDSRQYKTFNTHDGSVFLVSVAKFSNMPLSTGELMDIYTDGLMEQRQVIESQRGDTTFKNYPARSLYIEETAEDGLHMFSNAMIVWKAPYLYSLFWAVTDKARLNSAEGQGLFQSFTMADN